MEENIWKRFTEIWKPDFLVKNFDEIESNKTWKFWFLSNTLVALVITLVLGFGVTKAVNEGSNYIQKHYPDAKITLKSGVLSIEGIQLPIFVESKKDNSVFVVDTKGEKYDEKVLDNFDSGVFVSSTKLVNKENSVKSQEFDLSKIKDDFELAQDDLQNKVWVVKLFFLMVILIFSLIYLNFLRLISALWWALIGWIIGLVMKVPEITYAKTYFAVLNLYFIPLILSTIFMALTFVIPFFVTFIFVILFIINFYFIKKTKINKEKELSENK